MDILEHISLYPSNEMSKLVILNHSLVSTTVYYEQYGSCSALMANILSEVMPIGYSFPHKLIYYGSSVAIKKKYIYENIQINKTVSIYYIKKHLVYVK